MMKSGENQRRCSLYIDLKVEKLWKNIVKGIKSMIFVMILVKKCFFV